MTPRSIDGRSHGRWRFRVKADAERVLLVQQDPGGISQWAEMSPTGDGAWACEKAMGEGDYRFTYYLVRGQTCLNGGDVGLTAEPLGRADAEPATVGSKRLATA